MKVTPITAVLANAAVCGSAAALWAWSELDPDGYYRVVQEDGPVEWASFWAFAAAAGLAAHEAIRTHGIRRLGPLALLAGCALIALEEISWGQRLLGYRPPTFFLEQNFQQEFNLHNVASRELRTAALQVLIGGYGVALPLACTLGSVRRGLGAVGLVWPPLALTPAFAATLILYMSYPLRFTGEVVELMLGLALLLAGVLRGGSGARAALGACLGVLLAGAASSAATSQRSATPEQLAAVRAELERLASDLRALAESEGDEGPGCGLHKRVYTFVEQYDADPLRRGEFAAVAGERGAHFLDPWNSPYWIRDECDDSGARRSAFVYSFGPDRGRDSNAWEIRDDDLGRYLVRR